MNHTEAKVNKGRFVHPYPHGNEYVPAGVSDELLRACLMLLERVMDGFPHNQADRDAIRYADFAVSNAGWTQPQPQEDDR